MEQYNNADLCIAAGHAHRVETPVTLDLIMIEMQTGDNLGEDDTVWIADEYGYT